MLFNIVLYIFPHVYSCGRVDKHSLVHGYVMPVEHPILQLRDMDDTLYYVHRTHTQIPCGK